MQSVTGKCVFDKASLPHSWMIIGYILPMALACAGLAGLPIIMGIVSVVAALLCCLIFGERTEALMVVTPYSTLILSTAMTFYQGILAEQSAVVSLLTLFTGMWLLFLTVVFPSKRMTWIARPVWHGICLGIIGTLVLQVVPVILGVTPDGSSWHSFFTTILNWHNWNWPSLVLAILSVFLFLLWRTDYQPKALWLILLMWIIDLIWPFELLGVATPMQQPWQFWSLQQVTQPDWLSIIFMSASVALFIYVEVCQHLAFKMQHNFVMASVSNIISAISGGMVVGLCRFSGRVYKIERRSLIITLCLVCCTFYLWWSAQVPLPVLAVIVLYMMYCQFKWSELTLYKHQWGDLFLLFAAAFIILFLGILSGLWLVVSLSLIYMWWRVVREHAWPSMPTEIQIVNDVILITLPQVLLFANARYLLDDVNNKVKDLPFQHVYMDVSNGCRIGVTVMIYLQIFAHKMACQGKIIILCGLNQQNLDKLALKQLNYLPKQQLSQNKAVDLLQTDLFCDHVTRYSIEEVMGIWKNT